MKQVFKTISGVNVFDVPLPNYNENEILVAVEASVISTGTETMDMKVGSFAERLEDKKRLAQKLLDIYKDKGLAFTIDALKQKLNPAEQAIIFSPLGYSNAGIIVAKGNHVKGFNIGDRVACAGSGIAAHAEYSAIPVNLATTIPDDVTTKEAAFTTIGAIAMHGIRRSEVSFGETIVIVGLGLIGLLAVQIAKAWGLVVIGLDLNEERLKLAKEFGADFCFNANDINSNAKILEITNGIGADAVVIYAATKSSAPANQAFKICRRKGRVVVVGAIGMDLQRDDMYMKEIDFVMSTSYGPGRYDKNYEVKGLDYPIAYVRWTENRNMVEFIRLLKDKKINVEKLISNTFNVEQTVEAYKTLIDNPLNNIANIFLYKQEKGLHDELKTSLYPKPIPKEKIKVGIIGAGSFIQSNHLANLLKMPDKYELIAIASGSTSGAKSIGEKYKCRYITTHYQELLADKDIDAIIIGTRHNLHAQQVIDSIKAGKHVLVEKPLALTNKEIEAIKTAAKENPNVIVTVGFNRRYSPFVQKIKKVITNVKEPIVINCRVNAGFFAPDFWVQDMEEGGGRIIGEACHFIDLVSYIAGSEISSLNLVGIPTNNKSVKSLDNIICSISFQNGSIASLIYTSVGGKSMEKERIEVFTNKSSFVINDFSELICFDSGESNIILKEKDKGHYQLMEEFEKLLNGKESLILPFEHDLIISETSINIVNNLNSII
jgi:predicted dehydrogenase/threonine dehydrogenase-like Zn-dependent dehydrogenase